MPLFPPCTADALAAYLLLQAHTLLAWLLTTATHPAALQWPWVETLYFVGLQCTLLFALIVHPLLLAVRLPFLARMACSVYCAVGLLAVWARSYQLLWSEEGEAVAARPAGNGQEEEEAPVENVSKKGAEKTKKKTTAAKAKAKATPRRQQEEKAEEAPAPHRRSRRLREGKGTAK